MATTPCGWKGERFAQPPSGNYPTTADWYAAEDQTRTAKPCPRCNGRVEAIPEPTP